MRWRVLGECLLWALGPAFLLVWLATTVAYGGPADLTVDARPEARVTKRILFVVDCSGSMQGEKWRAACSAVLGMAEQPVDELTIGAVSFSDGHRRWEAVDGSGWLSLPSADGVQALSEWLARQGADGNTYVIPALQRALSAPEGDLTVALVSDGLFTNETSAEVLRRVEAAQVEREERAVVLAYTVGPAEREVMTALGRAGRGGAYREHARHMIRHPILPPSPPVQGQQR